MNEGNYREYGGGCYFHPKEVIVGVCHLCLNERLLILAAKHGVKSNSSKYDYYTSKTSINNSSSFYDINNKSSYYHHHHNNNNNKPKSFVSLPKIFAIASFFNTRDNSKRHRSRRHSHRDSDHHFFDDADATSTSLEDESFISIKFGDNGVASWDKTSSTVSKVSLEHCSLSWGGQTTVKDASKGGSNNNNGTKSVVEHSKPQPASMRWRKRIGQLLQVIRWKKNSKANVM